MSATFPGAARPVEAFVWSYAGFWWRVLAWFLDTVILVLVDSVIGMVTGLRQLGTQYDMPDVSDSATAVSFTQTTSQTMHFYAPGGHIHLHGGGLTLISLLLTFGYYTLLESSRWQATVGKRVCRLRVTDESGNRIGLPRAIGRYLGKSVSAFILGIGFLMVGWTRRKQGLHDLMASTLVMRLRPADTVFSFQQPPQH